MKYVVVDTKSNGNEFEIGVYNTPEEATKAARNAYESMSAYDRARSNIEIRVGDDITCYDTIEWK